jgi:hypothetical protein
MKQHLPSAIGFYLRAIATFVLMCCSATAQIVTLLDKNSTASLDLARRAGMYNWSVKGVNQLNQQWFWYSIGSSAVHSVETISAAALVVDAPNHAAVGYSNAALSVSIDYTLTGSAVDWTADLAEDMIIRNTSAAALPFHFFLYSDFNLLGTYNSDTAVLYTDLLGRIDEAKQGLSFAAGEDTVVTPSATHGEVALFSSTLDRLNSGSPLHLNDSLGQLGKRTQPGLSNGILTSRRGNRLASLWTRYSSLIARSLQFLCCSALAPWRFF